MEWKVKEKAWKELILPLRRGTGQPKIQVLYLIWKWHSVSGSLNKKQRFNARNTYKAFQ